MIDVRTTDEAFESGEIYIMCWVRLEYEWNRGSHNEETVPKADRNLDSELVHKKAGQWIKGSTTSSDRKQQTKLDNKHSHQQGILSINNEWQMTGYELRTLRQ